MLVGHLPVQPIRGPSFAKRQLFHKQREGLNRWAWEPQADDYLGTWRENWMERTLPIFLQRERKVLHLYGS